MRTKDASAQERLYEVQRELDADFLGLQGTRMPPREDTQRRTLTTMWEDNPPGLNFRSWHWSKPIQSSANDPRGVSLCIRRNRKTARSRTTAEGPSEGSLQGRLGMVRMRKRGYLDLACFVAYLPQGEAVADRRTYAAALEWMRTRIMRLPARCVHLILTDANTHLVEHEAQDAWGRLVLGKEEAQRESANGAALREFLIATQSRAINTMIPGGSGVTWHGHGQKGTRVDYVMIQATDQLQAEHVWVDYRRGLRLHLANTHTWRDHAPVCCRFLYRCWMPAMRESVAPKINRMHMQTLDRAPDLQKDLRDTINNACGKYAEVLEATAESRDVCQHWTWLNWIVQNCVSNFLPLLQKRFECWDDRTLDSLQDQLHEHKQNGPAMLSILANSVWSRMQEMAEISHDAQWQQHLGINELRIAFLQRMNVLQRVLWHWLWQVHLQSLQRQLRARRRLALARWREHTVTCLAAALRRHDSRSCWELSRALAATGNYGRKRWRGTCQAELPPVNKWRTWMEDAGNKGGQLAYCLWSGPSTAIGSILELGA